MPEFLEIMADGWDPYKSMRGARFNEAAMAAALDLLENRHGLRQKAWEAKLEEAIVTTDFPLLFGGILDRQILAKYAQYTPDWKNTYIKMGTRKDFRQAELHKVQGNEGLLPVVSEKGEYLAEPMSDSHYHLQVAKRGRQFDISWEALINDDLGAFSDIPERLANAAIYTDNWVAASAFVVAAGPNPALFGLPIADVDGQNVTNQGVLPLTVINLELTIDLLQSQTDIYGKPLNIVAKHLVVPRALEMTAKRILNSTTLLDPAVAGGLVGSANVVSQMGIQLHVNPFLPIIDTSGNRNGTWYLFADTASGVAVEFDYLRGHETPEICMKGSDKVSISGAPVSPFDGDFASDDVLYRVRVCNGAGPLDPRFVYAQVHA